MNTETDDTRPMAYVDGELDAAAAAAFEAAQRSDAALALRVQALRRQRAALDAAFADVADEPLPPALQQAAAALAQRLAAPPALAPVPVPSLDAARAARQQRSAPTPEQRARRAWAPGWGLAASLVLGVMLGAVLGFGLGRGGGDDATGLAFDARGGTLLARGSVAQALGTALAGAPEAAAPVAVQLSFVDRGGRYCRTFSVGRVAGLACRDGSSDWAVQALASAEPAPPGTLRQAATALPREILDAVDRRAAGVVLDAAAERAARDRGWQR